MKTISAIERLRSLPPVFRGSDLTVRFRWTSKTASQYLYLWKRRGLVDALGGQSDVFVNLLANPRPDWGKALLAAMPSAVVIGIEPLRLSGWTTQIPHRPSVAVNARQPVFKTEKFEVNSRDSAWFDTVRGGVSGDKNIGLPSLSPAWALADMLRESGWGACGLFPDDIEWSEIGQADEDQWEAARKAFGLPEPTLASMIESSRDHAGFGCG